MTETLSTTAAAQQLANPDATLNDVVAAIAASVDSGPLPEKIPFPALPKSVKLTPEAKVAMRDVAAYFALVELEQRRTLSDHELAQLGKEEAMILAIVGPLAKRAKAIREMVHHHMDVDAEERAIAVPKAVLGPNGEVIVPATPRDQHGHYLLAEAQRPHTVSVPDFNDEWQQQFSQGSPTVSYGNLEDMVDSGEIDKADYLAMTRQVRVVDEAKVWDFVRKNKARGLKILGKLVSKPAPSASMYRRPVK
jgi:hypothetical protein